jgi:acyl transferase domain-containing protein
MNPMRAPGAVAIIGMACRFPGAPDIATFWRNLCDGVESITRFEPRRTGRQLRRRDPGATGIRPGATNPEGRRPV